MSIDRGRMAETDPRRSARRPDRGVSQLAVRQHGAVSRRQAVDLGFSRTMIRSRLKSGRWLEGPFPGVYRTAGHPATWQHTAMAAVLSGPPGTLASYTTTAALFGLTEAPRRPHVTVPLTASVRRPGLVAHRSSSGAGTRCLVQGIPATVPARTLVDCAQILDGPQLMAIVDPALCRRLTTPLAVQRAAREVSSSGSLQGLPQLREVLAVWTDGIRPGSPAEMRLLRRIERWGFPTPERQVELRDAAGDFVARLDLAWPHRKVGFEYDGREYHGPRQWEADELRLARIAALGWSVEGVEKVDLLDGAERLRLVLARLLAADPRRLKS